MSRDIERLQSQQSLYKSMNKGGSLLHEVDDFESYFRKLQNREKVKTGYMTAPYRAMLEGFVNNLLSWREDQKNGTLNEEEEKSFEEVLNTIRMEEKSALKRLVRTALMDLCDTMAGDLEQIDERNPLEKKKIVDHAAALADLYGLVLNNQDKREIQSSFSNGEAEDFLTHTDHNMDGDFSKTLRALYGKYREPNQTEEEKAKWNTICNSYALRPYMKVISAKVKQEEKEQAFAALPEEEKEKIRQQQALKRESIALKQDPEQFAGLSAKQRNEIRRNAQMEGKQDRDIAALQQAVQSGAERYRLQHDYFQDVPNRLRRATAAFARTEKDSETFRRMFDSLNNLRHTDGYQNMEKVLTESRTLTEGRAQTLMENINQAVRYTQEYVNYAEHKPFKKMGFLGRRRKSAARETLRELSLLQRMILEDQGFMRDRQNKQQSLEVLEDAKKQKAEAQPMSVAETAAKMDNMARGSKINMVDLDNKVNGKKAVVSEKSDASGWVIVDTVKKADKGMSK